MSERVVIAIVAICVFLVALLASLYFTGRMVDDINRNRPAGAQFVEMPTRWQWWNFQQSYRQSNPDGGRHIYLRIAAAIQLGALLVVGICVFTAG